MTPESPSNAAPDPTAGVSPEAQEAATPRTEVTQEDFNEDGPFCARCRTPVLVRDGCDFEPGDICDECCQNENRELRAQLVELTAAAASADATIVGLREENAELSGRLEKAEDSAHDVWLDALGRLKLIDVYSTGETAEETVGHIFSKIADQRDALQQQVTALTGERESDGNRISHLQMQLTQEKANGEKLLLQRDQTRAQLADSERERDLQKGRIYRLEREAIETRDLCELTPQEDALIHDLAQKRTQLRLCEEHAGSMAKDFDASLLIVQTDRDQARAQLAESEAGVGAMREALENVLGSVDDPKIGWRRNSPSLDLLTCELCGKAHEDCTLIEHQSDCPITIGRAALASTAGRDLLAKLEASEQEREAFRLAIIEMREKHAKLTAKCAELARERDAAMVAVKAGQQGSFETWATLYMQRSQLIADQEGILTERDAALAKLSAQTDALKVAEEALSSISYESSEGNEPAVILSKIDKITAAALAALKGAQS